ncbi:hypothetical protein [Olivibacter sitiensis]|uniref:hypothetical protein n=1 Tax=Olivibacter sitiensis TaxID=376470 RepID=UPI00040D357B|nr:hypothetical protein [Olivibacter sitiensis]
MRCCQSIPALFPVRNMETIIFFGWLYLFVAVHLPANTHAGIPHPTKNMYVWQEEGIAVYAEPSLATDSVARFGYGEVIEIVEMLEGKNVGVTMYKHNEQHWISDEYLPEYRQSSNWAKVRMKGQYGYVLNTYLAIIPPPDLAHGAGFMLEDYLKSLSPVVFERSEGQTEEFCAKTELNFENGIRYTYIDFGPCEQCGHAQQVLYLPLSSKHEVTMMALHFFRRYGLFGGENTVLIRKSGNDFEMEGIMEYGQVFNIRINEHESGVLLIEDMYL